MFELHVVVAGIVMFNILKLIMKIVPNYPTPLLLATGSSGSGAQIGGGKLSLVSSS
jgi:hypothetical protein